MSTLALVWHAISLPAAGLGLAGAGCIAAAVFGLFALPPALVRPLIGLGAALLITAGIYETGFARATAAAERRYFADLALAAQARATAAESALAADRARAAADATTIAALRKEIDATPRNPAACMPRDSAERVRRIR